MASTITHDGVSITPRLVLGYSSRRAARNIVHPIIGRADDEVTMKPAGLRTGRLGMLVSTLAEALALEALHTGMGTCQLVDDELPGLNMTYIASGEIAVELDDESRSLWVVAVEFTEVL